VSSYNRPLVERLVPAIWDQAFAYGMTNPQEPTPVYRCQAHPRIVQTEEGDVYSTCACVEPSTRRSVPDPKVGGTIFAHLADIRSAWRDADIPQVERQAVLLRYGLDLTTQAVGDLQGVTKKGALLRAERGIGRLVAHLNGKAYRDVDDGDGPVLTD
jgi:hypothetical protein